MNDLGLREFSLAITFRSAGGQRGLISCGIETQGNAEEFSERAMLLSLRDREAEKSIKNIGV